MTCTKHASFSWQIAPNIGYTGLGFSKVRLRITIRENTPAREMMTLFPSISILTALDETNVNDSKNMGKMITP